MSKILSYYPAESYNSPTRCEIRGYNWMKNNAIYSDEHTWKISIKNGKRLHRRWTRNGGIAFTPNQYGGHTTIYNPNYDQELIKYDPSLQPDIEAGCYDQSYLIPYHTGMDEKDDY